MSLITVTRNDDDLFKDVVLICYDKQNGKYRSLNTRKRTIAAKLYDQPMDVINDFQKLKEEGRIKDFQVLVPAKK